MESKSPLSTPQDAAVELAQQLYREYRVLCFWHMKPELTITPANLPIVIRGLQEHGGRTGWMAAARLLALQKENVDRVCP